VGDGNDFFDSCRFDETHPFNFYSIFIAQASARAQRALKALQILRKNKKTYLATLLEKEAGFEVHHILPKHANGDNSKDNLVCLLFEDHALAHYVRSLIYKSKKDFIACSFMLQNETPEIRSERAKLAGKIGGVITQVQNRQKNLGRYNSKLQSIYGKLSAEKNRQQKTGAFDPKNLEKANKALAEKLMNEPERVAKRNENLVRGRQTQKDKKVNIGDPRAQRLKSLMYHGVVLEGVHYLVGPDAPVYHGVTVYDVYYPVDKRAPKVLSDFTLELYLKFGPPKPKKKKKENANLQPNLPNETLSETSNLEENKDNE